MRFAYHCGLAALILSLSPACGEGATTSINDVEPMTIEGGGVGSGAVLGELNVTVTDAITEETISGAQVQVGEPGESDPLLATTDDAGVATLRSGSLAGPQTITVVAQGYAPTTWFGANGANVTMQLRLRVEPDAPSAQVSGTIAGWGELAAPAPGHYRLAYVTYSRTEDFSLPENNLEQPTDAEGRAQNVCVYMPQVQTAPCNWELTTRTGPQALYAFVLDVDANQTPDPDDDIRTLITYGLATGLDLADGEQRGDVALSLLEPTELVEVDVTLPSPLVGLDDLQVYPNLDLGDEGFLIFSVPPLTPDSPSLALPALSGALAEATYELRAVAEASEGDEDDPEGTVAYLHPGGIGETQVFEDWLPRPTDLSVTDGEYRFSPVAGASVHSVRLEDGDGNPIWHVLLLDGRTAFTLPEVTPDPFSVGPVGDATFLVSAGVFPAFDPMDFSGDTLGDTVTHSSRSGLRFTP